MNLKRFSRQIVLPEIGESGQQRLSDARVLCVGIGGLGSPAALYLAAAGVGKIGLVDSDTVDMSNLQRQILFTTSEQGGPKTSLGKARLEKLNPEINIEAFNERFNAQNAERLLSGYDLIIDGSDDFETKFLINDAAYKFGIPMVYGAVNRFEGQVALFSGKQSSCYRCLYPAPPKAPIRNCAETGVLGAFVGVIGTLQATLGLQYIISGGDHKHPLYPQVGSLTLFDMSGTWNIRKLQVSKNPHCTTCQIPPNEVILRSEPEICWNVKTIESNALINLLARPHPQILLLDVRETEEWNSGHLQGAIHWPLSRIEKGDFPPKLVSVEKMIVYCKSGKRSKQAARRLSAAGIDSVYHLEGGLECGIELNRSISNLISTVRSPT